MNRLFFLGFLFTVIASVFWGAMGTAVQHLFQIKSGFFALGLVTLRQLSAGVLFVAIGTLIMPRKMWSIFNDRKRWCFWPTSAFFNRFPTPMPAPLRFF